MNIFRLSGKNHKGWRPGCNLGSKVELYPAAMRQRGMVGFNGIGKHMYQFRRGNTTAVLLHNFINGSNDLAGTLSGFGGYADDRSVCQIFETVPDFGNIYSESG